MKAMIIGLSCLLWVVSVQAQPIEEKAQEREDRLQVLMQSMADFWQDMSRLEFSPSKADKKQALSYLAQLQQRLLRQQTLLQSIEQYLVEGMLEQQQQVLLNKQEPTGVRIQTKHLEPYQQAQVMLNVYMQRLPVWAQAVVSKAEDEAAWKALRQAWQQAEAQWLDNQNLFLLKAPQRLQNAQEEPQKSLAPSTGGSK